MRKEVEKLLNSDVSGYQIEKAAGVRQSTISDLRNGKSKIDKIPYGTIEKLYKYWGKLNMITLTAIEEGTVQSQETFKDFEALKQHLLTTDYFSWIKDDEPDRELPDFTEAETVQDVQAILDEYDYSWWTLTTEDVSVWIKWIGKTTDGNKKYTVEGSSYEEVYNQINEKYGYGTVLDDEEEDRTDWKEEDYRNAIEESTSECYYHQFELTVE